MVFKLFPIYNDMCGYYGTKAKTYDNFKLDKDLQIETLRYMIKFNLKF